MTDRGNFSGTEFDAQADRQSPWWYVLFAFLLLVLFVGTLMPGHLKSAVENHLFESWPWASMAHFVLFAAIAALPIYGRGHGAFTQPLVLAMLLAGTTELLQTWVPGRHPLWRDVAIDLSGALAGLAGCAVGVRLRSLRSSYRT